MGTSHHQNLLAYWKDFLNVETQIRAEERRISKLEKSAAPFFDRLKTASLLEVSNLTNSNTSLECGEVTKFSLIIRWARSDLRARTAHIPELLGNLDFAKIFAEDKGFLTREFADGGLLSENLDCMKIYNKFLVERLETALRNESPNPPVGIVRPEQRLREDAEPEGGNRTSVGSGRKKAGGPKPVAESGKKNQRKHTNTGNEIQVLTPARSPRGPPESGSDSDDFVVPTESPLAKRQRVEREAKTSAPSKRETRINRPSQLHKTSNCFIYQNQERKSRFLYSYDWETETQEKLYKIERPRDYSCCVAVDNEIFDMGGVETKYNGEFGDMNRGTEFVEIFKISDQRNRIRGPPLLQYRKEFSAAAHEGIIYVTGGCFENQALNHCEMLNVSSRYEKGSDWRWKSMRDYLLFPRGAHSTNIIEHQLFVAGGIGVEHTDSVEIYDLANESVGWKKIVAMNSVRARHGSVVSNDLLYVAGGEDLDEKPLNSVEYYDAQQNIWIPISAPMRHRRRDFCLAVFNNRIHAIGGNENESDVSMEAYDPREGIWELIPWKKGLHSSGKFYTGVSMSG